MGNIRGFRGEFPWQDGQRDGDGSGAYLAVDLVKIYRSRERIFKLNFKYSTVGGKMGCAEKVLVALL